MTNDENGDLMAEAMRQRPDLAAALALIDTGRFVGNVYSYKAGHTLDVVMVRKLYEKNLLTSVSY